MFLTSGVLFYNVVPAVLTFLVGLIVYFKWSFAYWRQRGIEQLEPSIPFGNTRKLLTAQSSFAEQFAEFYHEFKRRGLKHGGVYMFNSPLYIPTDPFIIKDILQKDFSHFINRGFYVNEAHDPLSGNLFTLEGVKWKNLRAKLTATFTSGKIKMMFETMASCAKEMDTIMEESANSKSIVDIKDILSRFTTDVITSCAFGLDGNCLKNPDTPMRYYSKRIVENTFWETMKAFAQFFVNIKVLDAIKFKSNKNDVESFILDLVKNTVNYREKNKIYRKDFLHLLLQLKNRGKIADDEIILDENDTSNENGMTINELAAQVFIFFVAGYETSSTLMTFALYELALQQNIQDKVRKEMRSVLEKHNNEICYDAIMELTYLDQVVNETLRKHPPLAMLNRQCNQDYQVPNTNLKIEKGTNVVIPILGLHYDPDFYPEPEKFDPERFSEANKSRHTPFTWMPFGEGPRICIGLRFGVLQSKLGLVTLLKNYKISVNEKTELPLKLDAKSFTTATKSPIWLNVVKAD